MSAVDVLLEPWRQPLAWPIGALLFGLLIGSFANVCIHRIPLGESVVAPSSHCPRCNRVLRPWENVPVLSFLVQRGRCRGCRAPISWRYPLVEVANGVLWLAVAWTRRPTAYAFALLAFVTGLLVLSLIDLEHFILPDVITLPGVACGLLASLLTGSPQSALAALASAAGGYLAFALVAWTYQRTRGQEGLGQGDWKMAAMLGAFLGWQGMLLSVLLASLAGTLVGAVLMLRGGSLQTRLPLGTFLGLGGVAVVLVGDPLLRWYRGLYS